MILFGVKFSWSMSHGLRVERGIAIYYEADVIINILSFSSECK